MSRQIVPVEFLDNAEIKLIVRLLLETFGLQVSARRMTTDNGSIYTDFELVGIEDGTDKPSKTKRTRQRKVGA